MNKYSLINENNTRFDLKDFRQKAFIPTFKGQGYKHNTSFVKVGNTYQKDYQEIAQGSLTGDVLFSSYSNYLSFLEYVNSSQDLRIVYQPVETEFFRHVEFGGIQDMVDKGSTVEASVSFDCKGLWYKSTDTRFTIEEIEGQSIYDLLFDYTFNDYASVDVVFDNVGHAEAEMVVEFFGYVENPKIELFQNDVLKYTVSFAKVLQIGEKLIYSSVDGDDYVAFQNSSGVQSNAVSTLSLANDNFFRIPKGTSKIVVSSDAGTITQVAFKIITPYKGV